MMLTMLTSKLRKLLAAAVVGLGIMIGHAAPAEELKVAADTAISAWALRANTAK
jgi:hypothetical protein